MTESARLITSEEYEAMKMAEEEAKEIIAELSGKVGQLEKKCSLLKHKLDIAVDALKQYKAEKWDYEDEYTCYPIGKCGWDYAEKALNKIGEVK